MRRWLAGLVCGVIVGWTVQGLAQPEELLEEIPIQAARGEVLTIPPLYGHLVAVAVSSEIHHMYFEDSHGIIRIVRVGPPGARQQARHGFQLLSTDSYVIERE